MNGAPSRRGSVPEMTPQAAGMLNPTSASPTPSCELCQRRAAPRTRPDRPGSWSRRRSKPDVAGMPTQQFSRSWIRSRRKLPAFGGTPLADRVEHAEHRRGPRRRLGQVQAARLAVRVVAQVDVQHGRRGSTVTRIRSGIPSGTPGNGSCAVATTTSPAGNRSDRRDHPLLGVVEPGLACTARAAPSRPPRRAPAPAARRSGPRRAPPGSRPTTARARGSATGTCGSRPRRPGSPPAPSRTGRSPRPPRRRPARRPCTSSAPSSRSRPGAPWRAR